MGKIIDPYSGKRKFYKGNKAVKSLKKPLNQKEKIKNDYNNEIDLYIAGIVKIR